MIPRLNNKSRYWAIRISEMKISYCRLGIGNICNRLPRSFTYIVPYPIYQILDLSATGPGVENLANFELWQPVHLDGKGNTLNAAKKRVGHMWLQKVDVEDWMDVHTGGKIKPER